MCQQKSNGGLCIRNASVKNISLLTSLAWKLLTNTITSWAKLIITSHDTSKAKNHHYFVWRSILKGWEYCTKGIIWSPHLRSNMNIWHTSWIPNIKNLRSTVEGHLSIDDFSLKFNDIYSNDNWNFTKFSIAIPEDIKEQISKVRIRTKGPLYDTPIWSRNTKVFFITNSCYDLIESPKEREINFDWIWNLNCPNKIHVFLW